MSDGRAWFFLALACTSCARPAPPPALSTSDVFVDAPVTLEAVDEAKRVRLEVALVMMGDGERSAALRRRLPRRCGLFFGEVDDYDLVCHGLQMAGCRDSDLQTAYWMSWRGWSGPLECARFASPASL